MIRNVVLHIFYDFYHSYLNSKDTKFLVQSQELQ